MTPAEKLHELLSKGGQCCTARCIGADRVLFQFENYDSKIKTLMGNAQMLIGLNTQLRKENDRLKARIAYYEKTKGAPAPHAQGQQAPQNGQGKGEARHRQL